MSIELAIGVWNVEWASLASKQGAFFSQSLAGLSCDILCVTEGHANILPADGHVITSDADYGYPMKPGRRKVLLWSRSPWRDVDGLGSPHLPSGRFVAGTTDTPIGPTRVYGVCVPWHHAHVRTGRRDRAIWEDHSTYLEHLCSIVHSDTSNPSVLVGDFNQRVPRSRQPSGQSLRDSDASRAFKQSGEEAQGRVSQACLVTVSRTSPPSARLALAQ